MPSADTIAITVHAANLILGFIILLWLLDRLSRRWDESPDEVRMLHVLSISLLFGLLVVSGKQLVNMDPLSFDSFVIAAVKLSAVYITWKTHKTLYRTGERHNGGSGKNRDEDNPNRDIQA